jgi:hypothetical protein
MAYAGLKSLEKRLAVLERALAPPEPAVTFDIRIVPVRPGDKPKHEPGVIVITPDNCDGEGDPR